MMTISEMPLPSPPTNDGFWTQIIQPRGRLFDLQLCELWHYRDLILLFVRRDFVAQYKQTILGPVWHIIQPLLTTLMLTFVFGYVAKMPTAGVPPFLFYMAGTVMWSYFSAVLTSTSATFTNNAGIFGKVYFPRLAVPVAGLLSRLIAFSIQYTLFLGFLCFFMLRGTHVTPNALVLATPLLLMMMAAFAMGLGVIVSALTTRYRDLYVVVGFGVQLLMYATPVIYPLSALPEPYRFWMGLNPVAPVLELFRYAHLGTGTVSPALLCYSGVVTAVVLFVGILMFNKVERTFMDTV